MRIRLIASVAVIALVVAACGGSEHDEKSAPRTTAASAPTTTVAPAAGLQVGDRVGPKGTQLQAPSSPDTRQIDPEVRDVAVKLAERAEGVKKVDDRLDEIRPRLDPPRD